MFAMPPTTKRSGWFGSTGRLTTHKRAVRVARRCERAIFFYFFNEGLQAAYQPALNVSETETSVDTLSLLDWRRGAALVFGCEGEKGI